VRVIPRQKAPRQQQRGGARAASPFVPPPVSYTSASIYSSAAAKIRQSALYRHFQSGKRHATRSFCRPLLVAVEGHQIGSRPLEQWSVAARHSSPCQVKMPASAVPCPREAQMSAQAGRECIPAECRSPTPSAEPIRPAAASR